MIRLLLTTIILTMLAPPVWAQTTFSCRVHDAHQFNTVVGGSVHAFDPPKINWFEIQHDEEFLWTNGLGVFDSVRFELERNINRGNGIFVTKSTHRLGPALFSIHKGLNGGTDILKVTPYGSYLKIRAICEM